jgi:hypothetical protein
MSDEEEDPFSEKHGYKLLVQRDDDWRIYVAKWNGQFVAANTKYENVKLSSDRFKDLEEKIKKYHREQRRFKPIDAIQIEKHQIGRITSFADDSRRMIYFTFDDGSERKARREEMLSYMEKSYFVKVTPKNLQVLERIHQAESQEDQLCKYIEGLEESFEAPITDDDVKKAAGEKAAEKKGGENEENSSV